MRGRTAALIPSFNEAKAIGGLVARLQSSGISAYVVDDGSRDETASIARGSGATVIVHRENRGKGASLRDGFARIVADGYGFILVMDGDGQHDPDDMPLFFEKMAVPDVGIVAGNRMSDTRSMPLLRVVVNRLMSLLISAVIGQRVPDTQCGYRLIRKEVVEELVLDCSHYDAESELLVKAARRGWKIESAPIKTLYGGEVSRIRPFADTVKFVRLMVRLLLVR